MASILKVNTIQDATNSNTALSIDSSGRVLQPTTPVFWAYSNTNNVSTANTAIVFNLTDLNNGNHYSTSTGRFTAPVAGIYEFNVQALFRKNQVASGNGEITLYKNGSNVSGRGLAYGGHGDADYTHQNVNFVYRVSLAINDYVQPYTYTMSSGTDFYLDQKLAHFSGRLIG